MTTKEIGTYVTGLATATAGGTAYWGYTNQDGVDKKTALFQLGRMPRLYAPASRSLTLADTLGGIITSTSASDTVLTIPSFVTLGYTRDGVNPLELVYLVERGGTGLLYVVGASGVTIDWNDKDTQYLSQFHGAVMLTSCGADRWSAS